jgi:ABC-type Fe3+/spermidine/putrescine transport system ATPase subunit
MLELQAVSVRAGSFRLQDVTLSVAEGESHAILGPSGAGKTTLIETVIGFRRPESGRLRLAGQDLALLPIEHRGIGYVPQRLALFPHLTVRDNVAYSLKARGISDGGFQKLAGALVEATGIGHLLDRRPDTLSGGERQRVALVRALASAPRLLLLDEPFSGLNQTLRRDLWWLVKNLQAERGITALMITHDLEEAFVLCERVSVLIEGQIHQSAGKREVYHHPATVAAARFLGIKNLFDGVAAGVTSTGAAVEVDCPALGGRLTVPMAPASEPPAPGATVTVGIRAEHVALRDVDHPAQPSERALIGRIEAVMETDTDTVLIFRPDGGTVTIEIRVGQRVMRRFRIRAGVAGIAVGLPPEDLFLVRS